MRLTCPIASPVGFPGGRSWHTKTVIPSLLLKWGGAYAVCLKRRDNSSCWLGYACTALRPFIHSRLYREPFLFTKLDLRNAYHLVTIREGISGRHLDFKSLVMIIGLSIATGISLTMCCMVSLIAWCLSKWMIFSKSQEEHVCQVRQVLQRLWENRLCKADKYEFNANPVSFLGYITESEQ